MITNGYWTVHGKIAVGTIVTHIKYGEGIIVSVQNKSFRVQFSSQKNKIEFNAWELEDAIAIGANINHIRYGEGRITNIEGEYISVDFGHRGGLKRFNCNDTLASLKLATQAQLAQFITMRQPKDNEKSGKEKLELTIKTYQIHSLYHITHISNLSDILREGLLCKNALDKASKKYVDISDADIQQHRHTKKISLNNLSIHDCVPLFLSPKPPMLSARREQQAEIIYIHVSPEIFVIDDVVFTDGNARSNSTRFYKNLDDFNKLDWNILRKTYWNDKDEKKNSENKRRRAAEVLVPQCVPASHIRKITVRNRPAQFRVLEILKETGQKMDVVIDENFYYIQTQDNILFWSNEDD